MILDPWVRDINSTEQVVETQEGTHRVKAKHGECNLADCYLFG